MSSSSLEVPRRQKPEKRSKLWRFVVILATLAVAVGWLIWFLRTPDDLPTATGRVIESGVVDQTVYVGMFAVGDGFERTIKISEISVDVSPDDDVEVTSLICRGGTLGYTTDADSFCPELDEPTDGAEFSSGDSIVLAVTASAPTEVDISRLEISFRDGIRWGTKEAGLEGATLTFADHDPGVVDETEPEDPTTDRPEGEEPDKDKKGNKGKKDDEKGGNNNSSVSSLLNL